MKIQKVFYVSDSTALTAKSLGKSLLSQFDDTYFMEYLKPYINTQQKVLELCKEIDKAEQASGPAVVFTSMVNRNLLKIMHSRFSGIIDILGPFMPLLENIIGTKSNQRVGETHKLGDHKQYEKRIEAINFTLSTDDGLNTQYYNDADVILLGISRTGKTPTALYLALNFALKVANYPFTCEDLPHFALKPEQKQNKDKLFGLLITPQRLVSLRTERKIIGNYSQLDTITKELEALKDLLTTEKIPFVDTTNRSVEEIASFIVAKKIPHAKII